MNILILSLRGPSNSNIKGGAREFLRQIGKRLVKKGHSVRILCGIEKDFDGKKLPTKEYIDGIEVFRIGNAYIGSILIIREYFKDHKNWADIVIENMLSYPIMIPLYVNKNRLVIVHHLMGKSYFQAVPILKALIGFLSERTIPFIYNKERFITVSNATKIDLENLGIPGNQIKVISNGVDTEKFRPITKNGDNNVILFIGKYGDGRKRVEDLVYAFNLIKKDVPNAELIIAGSGGHVEKKLRELSRNDNSIKIIGPISDEEKIKLYQNSLVFVNPSIKEGFSLTAIEANACGTPVIAYEIQGLDTIKHGETGIIVKNHNPKDLAEAIIYLIKRNDIRISIEKNAVIHAKNYSWERSVDMLLETIK